MLEDFKSENTKKLVIQNFTNNNSTVSDRYCAFRLHDKFFSVCKICN